VVRKVCPAPPYASNTARMAASTPLNAPTWLAGTSSQRANASVSPAYSGYAAYASGGRLRIASSTLGLGPTALSLKSRRSSDRRPSSGAT
jgi:hypothetical protein